MKLLQVYNQYRSLFNGEEAVVRQTARLIEQHGGQARLLMRSSREIGGTWSSKAHAFWNGIYSRSAYRHMQQVLAKDRPDIVHVHNLYPLFSPSVLVACRQAAVPVVMSIHNQHMTCPRSDHLNQGKICERCIGGKEHHCVLQNCRQNLMESVAYALRSAVARKMRYFHDNVTLFIALSEFAKRRLTAAGFAADRVVVLPNSPGPCAATAVDPSRGKYIAFAGRMSPEKGIDTLLEAAEMIPECRLRLAGGGPLLDQVARDAPANVELLGPVARAEMGQFYRPARFLVLPSRTYEMCPLAILEAMSHGLPVVTSRLGAQRELVRDGITGLLFDPANPRDLAHKLQYLWANPQRCREMGSRAYEIAKREYGEGTYYSRLISIYRQAQSLTTSDRPAVSTILPAITGMTTPNVPCLADSYRELAPCEPVMTCERE